MTDRGWDLSTPSRTVVILGAGGYLGATLCEFFHGLSGNRVLAVSRGELRHRSFATHILADIFADDWSKQITAGEPAVLINCAFDFKAVGNAEGRVKFGVF